MKKTLLFMMLAVLGFSYAVAQESGPLPIVREGVKWVNEKVIVNHGDTTCYYYIYEIQGKQAANSLCVDGDSIDVCHYYTGPHIELDNDSIVSYLAESFGLWAECYYNYPYQKICDEGRNMIEREIHETFHYPVPHYYERLYYFASFRPEQQINYYLFLMTLKY